MVSRSWSKAFLALEFFIHLSLKDPRKLPWVPLGDRQFGFALVLQLTSSCGWFSVMNSDKLVSNIRRFGVRTLLIPKALHIYCNWLEKIFLFVLSTSCSSSFFPFLFISMLPAHEPAKAVSNSRADPGVPPPQCRPVLPHSRAALPYLRCFESLSHMMRTRLACLYPQWQDDITLGYHTVGIVIDKRWWL